MAKFIITVKSAFSLNLPGGEKNEFTAGTFETDDETIGKHWYVKANSVVIENKPAKDKPAPKDEGQNLDGQEPKDQPEAGLSEPHDDQQGEGQLTDNEGQSEDQRESEGTSQETETPKTEPEKQKTSRGRPKK